MGVKEVNEAPQSMLATFPYIEPLQSEQEKCFRYFIAGKDFAMLLPTWLCVAQAIFGELYDAETLHTSQLTVSIWVKSDQILPNKVHNFNKQSFLNS